MTPPLSHQERREVQALFAQADANRDKRINFTEFTALLRDLEAEASADEARIGFDEIDVDDDGYIDFEEFLAWWEER